VGDQLRITAQLIEAESGYHLWSDTYDRKLEDVFAIQDEIAGAIAGELRAHLNYEPLAASQAVDLAAYELYLKGRGLVAGRKADELFEGIDVLKSAIEIEPSYASAMATLAKAYFVAPYFTQRYPTVDMRENALHWAEKSLEIDPKNAEALSVKAGAANSLGLDPEIALELLRKAVQLNPNNVAANNFLGDLLMRMGALEEAAIYESKASELDPLGPVHLADLGYVYFIMGNYERVIELSNRALGLNTAYPHSHHGLIDSYWALGDLEQLELAIHAFINSNDMSEANQRNLLSLVDLAKGDLEEARIKLLMNYQLAREGKVDVVKLARVAVQHGDFDIAGELLLMANANKDGTWIFPVYVRMPEQAPDSLPWQEFWNLPGSVKLAEIRRANGLNPHYPSFGEAATP
jgi:adenylate cyclase